MPVFNVNVTATVWKNTAPDGAPREQVQVERVLAQVNGVVAVDVAGAAFIAGIQQMEGASKDLIELLSKATTKVTPV